MGQDIDFVAKLTKYLNYNNSTTAKRVTVEFHSIFQTKKSQDFQVL